MTKQLRIILLLLFVSLTAVIVNLISLDPTEAKEQVRLKKVQSGDTIYSLLGGFGFTPEQRNECLRENILPKNFVLAQGDLFKVVKKGSRTELQFFDRVLDRAYVFWREQTQKAGAERVQKKFQRKVATAEGQILGSIVRSIREKVGDELLAYRFMDAYILDYNLQREVQRGARFKIVYEKLYDDGHFVRFGEVLKTELEIGDRNIRREFAELPNGGGIFFDPTMNREERFFYAPVDYVRVSSLFQPRRFHPIKKHRRAHEGIDFEMPEGANIYTAQAGVVLRMGRNRGAGKYVVIRHENGFESYYNHLSAHAKGLSPGDRVKNGQLIGYIGCTGYCTKPHLHFAVRRGGRFVDPIFLIRGYAYNQRDYVSKIVAQVSR